jgi:alpha-beta hydrolase superfamily lysophospholipase
LGDEARQFPASDGYAFAVRVYPTPSTPVGRVVFLHGIRSHGGWYTRSCQEFAAAGYEVHFLDRRGAGLNTAARGDTPSLHRLLDDITEYLTALRVDSTPVFLAGISWGGKPALAVAARTPHLIDGLVLLCPGFVPVVGVPPLTKLRIALARLFNPTKKFPVPLNDPHLFTSSPEWQRFIADDPHGLTEATARFLFASARLDLYLKRVAKRVTAPVLCLLAEHEAVIDNAGTRAYLKRLTGAKRVDVTEYPSTHHTLEFETVPFVTDVIGWLRATMSP